MKLKKILSGFLAAAMAVTSMVTASITAGAEDETTIWTGSFSTGTDWSATEDVSGFANAKEGDVLKITCSAVGTEGYHQIMLKDMSWGNFQAGALSATAGAASLLQLNAADAVTVQTGFKIAGYDCTISKIDYISILPGSETLWTGSFSTGTDWSATEDVSGFANAKEGDVLKITCSAVGTEGYHQIMLKDMSWGNFQAGALSATAGAASLLQLNAADAVTVQTGFKIAGYDCTISKIELLQVGTAATTHTITIDPNIEHGTVTADNTEAAEGDKVTLTVTPAEGYELDELSVAGATTSTGLQQDETDPTKWTFNMLSEPVTVTATFTVMEVALTGITLDKTTASLVVGATTKLTATKAPANTTDTTAITWISSNTDVATVAADGTVTAKAAGTATITATCGEKTATCAVTVTADAKPCTGITLDKTTAEVTKGKTVTLTATAAPADTTDEITWTSSNTDVATVAADGTVTAKAAGTATITATCGEKTATCAVTVTADAKPCTGITLDETAEVTKGKTVTLTATAAPADTTDEITWSSDTPAVATVSATGVVTGVARGTAKITATCGEKTATCEVSVTEDKTVTPPVSVGGQKSYDVVTTAADGTKVKTVDTVYSITEADLQCKGYEVTITNGSNGKSITKTITNAYKSVTVKSTEDLGNDTFTGYFLVVRVKNVPENVTLSYSFKKIS